jgi:hypothetical protein
MDTPIDLPTLVEARPTEIIDRDIELQVTNWRAAVNCEDRAAERRFMNRIDALLERRTERAAGGFPWRSAR